MSNGERDGKGSTMGDELLLDLVALFKTEAAHAVLESERVRLALEADAIAALHTSAKTRAA